MAEWKKVVISGTNTTLGEVTASGGFSGDGSGLTGVQASGLNIEGFTNGTAITVAATDKLLLSDAGVEKYINVSQLFDTSDFDSEVAANSAVSANTAKVSADGSVREHSDVTDAGSGAIITDVERDKLTNIEDGADVTDTANVTAAGALMDSEVTNLDEVKAFDSRNYATAEQGIRADAALPASDVSAFGATLIDDASASAARTTLGLGSIATLNSIDISSNTNLAAGTGVTLTGDRLSIGQSVGTSDSVTFNNIVANGNLTVQGDITSVNTTNLNVEDKMIL